jgi:hypothetical protein
VSRRIHPFQLLLVATAVVSAMVAAWPAAANAVTPELTVRASAPDSVTPTKPFKTFVYVRNESDGPLSGEVSVTYRTPPTLQNESTQLNSPSKEGSLEVTGQSGGGEIPCEPVAAGIRCYVQVANMNPGVALQVSSRLIVPILEGSAPFEIEVEGLGAAPVVLDRSITSAVLGLFAIERFEVEEADQAEDLAGQAAGTPRHLANILEFPSFAAPLLDVPQFSSIAPVEQYRDVVVHVPPGVVGNPTAVEECTIAQLSTLVPSQTGSPRPTCPADSQIGWVHLAAGPLAPLFNLEPAPGTPAAFGFSYAGVNTLLQARLRPNDNGIDIVTERIPAVIPIPVVEAQLWGVPVDSGHDYLRNQCLSPSEVGSFGIRCPSAAKPEPFLRMPTACDGPLDWSVAVDTYQHPGAYVHASTSSAARTGCDLVPFEPELASGMSSRAANQPATLSTEISIPQERAPAGIGQSDVKAVSLSLPSGVVVNPAAADGLQACDDQHLRLGLGGPSDCPAASRLGSVRLESPLLDHSIEGSVFVRPQQSSDPESGDLYRLALELRSDQDGIAIKLPGSLRVSAGDGRLTASFDDLPQLPFSSVAVELNGGPRAPLMTPVTCGTYTTRAELTPWARPNQPVAVQSAFTVDQGCASPGFAPGFEAGVLNNTAGSFSPYLLRITRDPDQPNLSRIEATSPEGELAKLAGVPVCGDAQAASGECPAGSRIGRIVAGIGEGSSPLYLPQAGKSPTALYLTGPYRGAPYSVLAEVPAQAGPFDLGEVLVRSALRIDPETTQVSVVSDPLPQIFGGVPISYRDVRVEVDRPEFTVNPTDCEPTAVTGTIVSSEGGSAAVTDRFQVADCAHLAFKPKLSLRLKGKTRRGGNPALTAILRMPQKGPGANIARAAVTLPGSEFIAQDHLNNVCTRVQFAANGGGGAGCPKGSVYGRARAFSPLLDRPLEGPVYLRSNGGERELPDLVASLDGPIHLDLVGYVDSDKRTGGLRTTFAKVPDAPVSRFVLKMGAGRKSLLENSTNICRGKRRATARFDGQNGKIHDFRPVVKVACGKGGRRR